MHQPKISRLWWLGNIRYFIYFLREFTGALIAFYAIFFLAETMLDPALTFVKELRFKVVSWIGLSAAVFHTITWFWVTVKISPIPLKKPAQIFLFIIFVTLWLLLSYFLLNFFYVP